MSDPRNEMLTLQDGLTRLGIRQPLTAMAMPAMYWTPGESDPDAQASMLCVYGAQKGLKRMGYKVKATGHMDAATQNALAQVSGPTWASKPWMRIYERIIAHISKKKRADEESDDQLEAELDSGLPAMGDTMLTPINLALLAGALVVGAKLLGGRKTNPGRAPKRRRRKAKKGRK